MKDTLPNRLRQALLNNDMSQTDLAKASGIRASSISDYLTGKYEPKQDKIYLLAKALRVEPAWLMGYDLEDSAYYTDPTVNEYAEQLRTNPNMRLLFDATKDMKKEDIDYVVDLVNRLKGKE